jgi:hypothetical protein
MAEKSMDFWHLDDWNRALCQHYFAEGTDTTPVTRLAVTSEELSKATKTVIGPDEARKALVNLLRATLAHRSLGSDAQKRAEQWERTANIPPPFLTHLLFTCMVVGDVAEQLQSVGDFRGRLTKLLGWGSGHGLEKLPALWRLLRDWSNIQYERHGSIRRLVLPSPPTHLAIIGYQYSLAFPTRRDQERLRDVLRAEGLVGVEPPVTRVFRVLENQLVRFTPQFQETYHAFRDLYQVSTRSASAATAFWSVVREAALNVSLGGPGHSRLPNLQLALEVDLDGYSLAIMSSREFSTKDFRTIPFPLGLKDYSFLVLKTDDEPIEAVLLKAFHGRSVAVLPAVFRDLGRAIRHGILLFVPDETGQMHVLTRELPEAGKVVGLVTDTLLHRFTTALYKAGHQGDCLSQRSRYPGWNEIEIGNGTALSDVDFDSDPVLSEIPCLQQVLRPSGITIVGGARAGQSYVGLARFLPEVIVETADTVIAQGIDRIENISLRRSSDTGAWQFPFDREPHLDGAYQLRSFAKNELLSRRNISFTSEVRGTDYVPPSNPDSWLGEGALQESAAPSDWPKTAGDCFQANEYQDRRFPFDSALRESGKPQSTEQSPVVNDLVSFVAARSCYQQGIPEFELVGLLKENLALDWNSAWYVLRAWVEIGAFETLSLRTWRTRKCFAKRPCLVVYRTQSGYHVVLFGLAASPVARTFEAACTSLKCRVYRKPGLSPWVPGLISSEVASIDELYELRRRSGLEQVYWLKDFSEVAIPIRSVHGAHGSEPQNWDVYRVWDFDRRSFVRPEDGPHNENVVLSWYRRSDRIDYFSISQRGSAVWWGWSKTWALLRAYDLAHTVPFKGIGHQSIESFAAHIHLPLSLARVAAITGPLLPGPMATDSNTLSYVYSFASHRARRKVIQSLWPDMRREQRPLPIDLELLWRQSTTTRQDALPIPVLLRERLASDPLLRRFAKLHSIPKFVLPILLTLSEADGQSGNEK